MLAPLRIKRQPEGFGAGSLGQVGRPVSGPALRVNRSNGVGLSLSDVPPGCPKGISSDHHIFLETRKGVPTNWAGTPDAHYLELPNPFAKPLFAAIPAKMSGKSRFSGCRRW
jgi:hypothetical protein